MKTVFVLDEVRASVLRYIVIEDDTGRFFYGGNTWDNERGPDSGPHVTHTAESLLDLLARLANEDGYPYTVQSTFSGRTLRLRPEMMADDVADVLGIDVKDVLARYSLLVRPPAV